MKKLLFISLILSTACACSTVNNTGSGCNNLVLIEQPKSVSTSTSPALTTGNNTLPMLP